MDSASGKDLYKFDRSMMERLSDGGYPMSQISVQRRMRPAISHFIRYDCSGSRCIVSLCLRYHCRTILYPELEDNNVVKEYPCVQGMDKDVFFLNHINKENGTEDSVSKFNMYEVRKHRV